MTNDDLLKQGIAKLKNGHKAEARKLLMQVIHQDEHNETAWLWLSGAVDTDEERRTCMEKVLAINPDNKIAKQGIDMLWQQRVSQPTEKVWRKLPESYKALSTILLHTAETIDKELEANSILTNPGTKIYDPTRFLEETIRCAHSYSTAVTDKFTRHINAFSANAFLGSDINHELEMIRSAVADMLGYRKTIVDAKVTGPYVPIRQAFIEFFDANLAEMARVTREMHCELEELLKGKLMSEEELVNGNIRFNIDLIGSESIGKAIQEVERLYQVAQAQAKKEREPIPDNVRQAVLDRDDYLCRYCGRRSQTMEVDHVIPVSQGGRSTLNNLLTACRECNRRKSGRTPQEAGMEVLPVRTSRK